MPKRVWLYFNRGGRLASSAFLAELTIWRLVARAQTQPNANIPKPTTGPFKYGHISRNAPVGSASSPWKREQLATYHQMKRTPKIMVNDMPPMASATCA